MNTPWGPSQTVREIAPGIVNVTTAGHGGIKLSADRLAKLQALIQSAKSWAGFPWFEEDCDWAQVALAFPDCFDAHAVFCAVEMSKGEYLSVPASYFETAVGGYATRIAERFALSVANKWRLGSMGTSGKGWNVSLTRSNDSKWVKMADYPSQSYYTDAELAAVTVAPEPEAPTPT